MGYSLSNVTVTGFKSGIISSIPINIPRTLTITGTSYEDVFKITIDASGIDYLYFNTIIKTTAGTGSLKILSDTTSLYEETGQASDTFLEDTLDLTGINDIIEFKIRVKCSQNDDVYLTDFVMYPKE